MNPADVPIPARMRHLPVDRRGYPVPPIVMTNDDGSPIFAANDERVRQRFVAEDRCHVCGGKLLRGRWFVGGQLCACAAHGLFLDPGMHDECAHYALKVCPYLAAPAYGRLVGPAQLAKSDRADTLVLANGTEQNERPDLFVAVMAVAQEITKASFLPGLPADVVYGVRPKPGAARRVELWRHGNRLAVTPWLITEIGVMIKAAGDDWRADVLRLLEERRDEGQ